jgi:heme exporter protein D
MPHLARPLPVRLYLGIHDHFPARRSEWVLACIMVAWGWILLKPTTVFASHPSWSQMAAMMDEATWGWLAIAIGSFRLLALIVNGTFARTWYGRWSPHVRALASFLSCFLWFQISFGLWASDAATTGLAVYPGLLVLDAMNIVAASKDAASMDKAVADGR